MVMPQPFRKIRVRKKMAAKCDEIRVTLREDRLGTSIVEPTCRDHLPSK